MLRLLLSRGVSGPPPYTVLVYLLVGAVPNPTHPTSDTGLERGRMNAEFASVPYLNYVAPAKARSSTVHSKLALFLGSVFHSQLVTFKTLKGQSDLCSAHSNNGQMRGEKDAATLCACFFYI